MSNASPRRAWGVFLAVLTLILGLTVALVFTDPATDLPQSPPSATAVPTANATPTPGPTVSPIPTPGLAGDTPANLRRPIDEVLEGLPRAYLAFNAPATLRIDDTAVIELRMSDRVSIADLQEQLTAVGEREGARIRASNEMEANLAGLDFKIQGITPTQQPVGSGITQWLWEIEATAAGRRRLHLTLTALITVDGQSSRYAVQTFARTLRVESVPVPWYKPVLGFVSNNEWVLTALVFPLAAFLYRRRRKATVERSSDPGPVESDRKPADGPASTMPEDRPGARAPGNRFPSREPEDRPAVSEPELEPRPASER